VGMTGHRDRAGWANVHGDLEVAPLSEVNLPSSLSRIDLTFLYSSDLGTIDLKISLNSLNLICC
jgi:hypothetical protein